MNLLFLMAIKRLLTKTLMAAATGIIFLACVGVRAQELKSDSAALPNVATTGDLQDAQQVSQLDGKNVAEVRVVSETGEVLVKDIPELPLSAAHPYDAEAVRESLRKLFATGDYSDLRAEVTNVSGGIRVDFVAQRNYFVGVVRVLGLIDPPSDSTAYSAVRLPVGTQFRESEMSDAVIRLEELLAQEGFYQAKVTAEHQPDATTRRMNLTFHVTPGKRAKLGAITLKNMTAYPDTEILSRSKLKPGQQVLSKTLEHGGDRLRAFLKKNDYLRARTSFAKRCLRSSDESSSVDN